MKLRQDLRLSVKFYGNVIRCVDEKLSSICNLLCDGPLYAGPASEPHVPCHKSGTAVQSTSLRLPNKLFVTPASYNKITLHTVMTWAPGNYYLFQNLKSYLRGVRYAWQCMTQDCLRWRCESFPFNGLWRHKLDDVTSATNSCVFVENVHFTDIYTVSEKTSPFLFFWHLCQISSDFANFW